MNKRIIISLLLVILWMGVIFSFSAKDHDTSDSESKTIAISMIEKVDEITHADDKMIILHQSEDFIENINHYLRKSAHAMLYFMLSILVLNLLMQINKFRIIWRYIINISFCVLYACSDEIHQTFVPGRGGEFRDVLIDTIGVIVGCLIFFITYTIIKRRKEKRVYCHY